MMPQSKGRYRDIGQSAWSEHSGTTSPPRRAFARILLTWAPYLDAPQPKNAAPAIGMNLVNTAHFQERSTLKFSEAWIADDFDGRLGDHQPALGVNHHCRR